MRFSRLLSPLSLLGLLLLPSCGLFKSGPGGDLAVHGKITGPFDKNGNYHEEWADDPSKWGGSRPSSPVGSQPIMASNDLPPDNARPLIASNTSSSLSKPRPTRGNEVEVANRDTARSRQKLAIVKPREPEPTRKVLVAPKAKATGTEKSSEKSKPSAKPKPTSSEKSKSTDKPKPKSTESSKPKTTEKGKSSSDKPKATEKSKSSSSDKSKTSSDKPKPKTPESSKPKTTDKSKTTDKPKPKSKN